MIRNWSIRNRVLLLALLPVISLGVALSSYFVQSRVRDLKAAQATLGRTMADQLASASLYGVLTENPGALRALAESGVREPNVQSVTIASRSGVTLAKVQHEIPPANNFIDRWARRIGATTGFEGALVFTRPIMRGALPVNGDGDSIATALQLGSVTVKLSEAHFAQRQAQIIVSGGLILLVCLGFSILLALIISGSVVAPIERVIVMVQRFTSGKRGVRVAERSGGELRQLEHGINQMAASAEHSQQQLQNQVHQATAELRGTLEEFEIKSVELDLARKRALEASRVKSEFLANMSHEVRTPMNAVLGFSDLLTRTPLNTGQRGYLATIQQSAHTLLTLLDNILDASRLEVSSLDIQPVPFVLRELLEETLRVQAIGAYAKQLELVLDSDGRATRALLGDRIKLMRILTNLVSNAIKFTDAGSVVIRARCSSTNDGKTQVTLEVADTGIGIRAQDQRRLFRPFSQVHGAADRPHEGAGLGLFISKRLVQLMGGTLALHSVPGEGSRFTVTLTLASAAGSATPDTDDLPPPNTRGPLLVYESSPQAADALHARLSRLGWSARMAGNQAQLHALLGQSGMDGAYVGLLLGLNYAELANPAAFTAALPDNARRLPKLALVNSVNAEVQSDTGRQLQADCQPKSLSESQLGEHLDRLNSARAGELTDPPRTEAPFLQGHTIVVADDNRINRLLERILLEKYGARVLEACSGQELIALVAAQPVSLILLDMQMPGEDGWQVAARLRADAVAPASVPVVALSATSSNKPADELAAAGLSGWLMKPLEESALRELVSRHLQTGPAADPSPPRVSAQAMALHESLSRLRPQIRDMLREDLPTQGHAIEHAAAQHDLTRLRDEVHKLNGSAAFCGFTELRELCTRAENQLRAGNLADIPDMIARIVWQLSAISEQLKRTELSPALPS